MRSASPQNPYAQDPFAQDPNAQDPGPAVSVTAWILGGRLSVQTAGFRLAKVGCLALSLGLSGAGFPIAGAQDPFGDVDAFGGADPFDVGDSPFEPGAGLGPTRFDFAEPDSETVGGEDGEPETAPDAALSQMIERVARDPDRLPESLEWLARRGDWADFNRLLRDYRPEPDSERAAAVAERLGTALTLRAGSRPELSDEMRQWLGEARGTAARLRQDADGIRRAIEALDSPSVDAKLGAMRTLVGGGSASVIALVDAVVSDPDGEAAGHRDRLRLLKRLAGGMDALRQLALYGAADVRPGALAALGRIDPAAGLGELLTGAHAADATADERQRAGQALERHLGQIPGFSASAGWLAKRLRSSLAEARMAKNDHRSRVVWGVDEDRLSVRPGDSYEPVASYRHAYDAAARLRRLGVADPDVVADMLIAEWNYRILADPDSDPRSDEALASEATRIDGALWSRTVERGLRQGDWPAVVGLLRLVGVSGDEAEARAYLRSGGGYPSPLVDALLAGEPRVRYEAVLAIRRLGVTDGFPGSSHFRRVEREMERLGDRPVAFLVETRRHVTERLERLLDQLGYETRVHATARSLERAIADGGDIGIVVAKWNLADVRPIELVDRIRRTPGGGELPILFFGSPGDVHQGQGYSLERDERWPTPTRVVDEPMTVLGFRDILNAADMHRRLPPLSGIDRRLYRDAVSGE